MSKYTLKLMKWTMHIQHLMKKKNKLDHTFHHGHVDRLKVSESVRVLIMIYTITLATYHSIHAGPSSLV